MEALTIYMGIIVVIGGLFLAWLYTPRGKKWLKDL